MFLGFWMRRGLWLTTLVGALIGTACQPSRPGESQDVAPELKLERVKFRVWRGADLRVTGEAATVSLRRDSSELRATDVAAVLPRDPEPVHVTAPVGQGVLEEQRFQASGGVVLRRGDQRALTESARYDPAPGGGAIVRGDQPVVLLGPTYRMDGTGFTLDPATGEVDVHGPAKLIGQASRGAR